ncbi:MAG TPA: hypothetical protein PKY77_03845 [Phycisphaerae bacterium]|nr:hypothetical protein [Phycisphaerae bacterium]HRY70910.1 hypothetical protein [Phycisphaerae bacterium]HSA30147.1 hypothetical protein [Phycisphaerae bacterium]
MVASASAEVVLSTLAMKPSRASAAAIGHHYVLDGAPSAIRLRGVDLLCGMVCDWSVALLDELISSPHADYVLRQYALHRVHGLLRVAMSRGYANLGPPECRRLMTRARRELQHYCIRVGQPGMPAVDALCSHLGQAVADGLFGDLPDF